MFAKAVLGGVLLLAAGASADNAQAAEAGCELVPPSLETVVDCCCTNDQCSYDSCDTNTCANDTCSRDSCTTDTCSRDTCSRDTCTTDTCSRDTCENATCETDTCQNTDDCPVDTCSRDTCDNNTCSQDTCSRDSCDRDTCSYETCSRDSCDTNTCSVATCSYDSCDTETCGTDGCNFVPRDDSVVVDHQGRDDNSCQLPQFGADLPSEGTAHLTILNARRSPLAANRADLSVGRRASFYYQMAYAADADRDSTYEWKIADRSSDRLQVLGTTRVGPFQGVMQRPSNHDFNVTAPRDLAGTTQWIKFEVIQDEQVIREQYLFLNVAD